MTTQIKRRRGTTTEHSTFTGAEGEITIDTTKDTVVVHDGSTAGGHPLAKESSIAGKVDSSGDTMTGDLTVPNVIVSGNVDGRDVSVDGTKLDGIEAGADVTDATNVAAAGAAMETGAAFTGNVTFGDNDKAIFGAGSDLQIYHDGSDSIIANVGTGNLSIQGTNLRLRNANNTADYITCNDGGDVKLKYANANKLVTTSTGIDVTGTVTADGLTVDAASDPTIRLFNTGTVTSGEILGTLEFYQEDGSAPGAGVVASIEARNIDGSAGAGSLVFTAGYADSNNDRMLINSNGDISFYEDTGTTPKFFWDASAESLGIGTSSPRTALDVAGRTTTDNATVGSGTASTYVDLTVNGASTSNYGPMIELQSAGTAFGKITNYGRVQGGTSTDMFVTTATTNNLILGTNNAERMRIDSSGNLLVGMASPSNLTTGFAARANSLSSFCRDTATADAAVLALNKKTGDGDIVIIQKDGSTVGSIGAGGGRLYIGSADTGVYFDEGVDSIFPYNPTTRQSRDNAIDLGYSTIRYKDLYLSGGVYLGGTGSANKLDDYEEGTWIPVLTDFTNNSPTSARGAYYTKIGNIVFASCNFINVDTTGMTSGAELYLDDLPYTSKSTTGTNYFVAGGVQYSGTSVTNQPIPSIVDGTDYMRFFDSGTFWSVSNLTDDAADLYINVVYLAA